MITTGVASYTAITSAICFRGHRESLPSIYGYGFSLGLPSSASRKFSPLTATIDGKDKDPLYSHRALEPNVPNTPLLHPVIEKTIEDDLETQLLKNLNTLDLAKPTSDNLITSNPSASITAKTSRKSKNHRVVNTNVTHIDPYPVFRYPLGTEAALKAMLDRNTMVFVVDKRADKIIIKDTFKRMFKITAKKVNTSITPDGTKKAFIMLPSECKALDVAKKINIM